MKSQSSIAPPMAGSVVTQRGATVLQVFVACMMGGVCGGVATGHLLVWLRGAFLLGSGAGALMLGLPAMIDFGIDVAERLSQRDFNQDGKIGNRVIFTNKTPLDAKPESEQFESFVWQCKTSTAARFLEGQGFTREQIEDWRALLIANRLAAWKSEKGVTVGWELLKPPDEILRLVEWPGAE